LARCSQIANELVDPPTIMALLKIDEAQKAEAHEKKQIPLARLDQLEGAM
jgi:hypothetical protein